MWDLSSIRGLGTASADRRRYRRKNLLSKQIGIQLSSGNTGVITDLSEGGLSVLTDVALQLSPGKLVQIDLPDSERRVEATCELAWTKVSGLAGLRFLILSDGSQRHIREWLGIQNWTEAAFPAAPDAAPNSADRAPESPPATLSAMYSPAEAESEGLPQVFPVETSPDVEIAAPALSASEPTSEPRPSFASLYSLAQARGATDAWEVPAMEREIADIDDPERALNLVVGLTRLLTQADGVALALSHGEEMTCYATTGEAPDLGARLQMDSGLSGECVRTGLTVRCDDTESDPRANRAACRALNLRSLVIVPLYRDGKTVGLLEILSQRPRAFYYNHVLMLPRIGDLIMRVIAAIQAPSEDSLPQLVVVPDAAAWSAEPQGALAADDVNVPVDCAEAAPELPAAPALPSAYVPVTANSGTVVCDVCGCENATETFLVCKECDVPLALPPHYPGAHASSIGNSAETLPAPKKAKSGPGAVSTCVIVFLLAALASPAWHEWRNRRVSAASPAQAAPAERPQAAPLSSPAAPAPLQESIFKWQPSPRESSTVGPEPSFQLNFDKKIARKVKAQPAKRKKSTPPQLRQRIASGNDFPEEVVVTVIQPANNAPTEPPVIREAVANPAASLKTNNPAVSQVPQSAPPVPRAGSIFKKIGSLFKRGRR